MAMTMVLIMIGLMLLGFPMMVPMLVATLAGFMLYLPNLRTDIIIQQMISGNRTAVPLRQSAGRPSMSRAINP